jgi:hypothetical protein
LHVCEDLKEHTVLCGGETEWQMLQQGFSQVVRMLIRDYTLFVLG